MISFTSFPRSWNSSFWWIRLPNCIPSWGRPEFVGVCRFVDGLGFQAFFGDFSARQCNNFGGKREEPCRYASWFIFKLSQPPAQELSFFENRASQEKIVTCRFQEHWSGKQTLDSPTLLFFFFDWSCAIWGLKMVDYLERMRWLFGKET